MKKTFLFSIIIAIIAIIIVALVAVLLFLNKESDNLDARVYSVKAGQEITSPFIVEGEARGTWFFEASFPIKITDEQGNVLGQSFVQAQSDWMTGNFVPFKGEISFVSPIAQKGFLVLQKDNPSGLPENDKEIKIPVEIPKTAETMKIKVYFNNNKMDPEFSCNKVFPVEREILKTESTGSAALAELFKGPTEDEKNQGFFTSI